MTYSDTLSTGAQSTDMNSYFNDVYEATQADILKNILIKTGDVGKIEDTVERKS